MVRIVVDTNVIISALVFGGAPRIVLDGAAAGFYECCFSQAIRDEAKRVLQQKFGWTMERVEAALTTLFGWFAEIKPKRKLSVIKDDPDDDRVLRVGHRWQRAADHFGRSTSVASRKIRISPDSECSRISGGEVLADLQS